MVIALYDNDFEVRWLATEGLISIGTACLKPLLEALAEKPGSLDLRQGAHHVLHDLRDKNPDGHLEEINWALSALESSAAEDDIQVVARKILAGMK
jgi:HEAT repeat protein